MAIFKNREVAGELLAKKLKELDITLPYIFALPRGGVSVGKKVADMFNVPLDIFIVQKIGAPHNSEFSIGAVTETGYVYIHKPYIEEMKLTKRLLREKIAEEKKEIERRRAFYRKNSKLPAIKGEIVILIDDGLATGITAYAAVRAIKRLKPKELILAIPVSSREAFVFIEQEVDVLLALHIPEVMETVGQYYEDFHQLTDQEVIEGIRDK